MVLDESGAINEQIYRDAIVGYPTSLLIDADGVIAAYYPGQVKADQLLETLEALLES